MSETDMKEQVEIALKIMDEIIAEEISAKGYVYHFQTCNAHIMDEARKEDIYRLLKFKDNKSS